jgi:hypothetical protein
MIGVLCKRSTADAKKVPDARSAIRSGHLLEKDGCLERGGPTFYATVPRTIKLS